jgi:xylose isomerase
MVSMKGGNVNHDVQIHDDVTQWRFSANASFFGAQRDRFNEYQPARTLDDKFALVAQVEGITGVELKYPRDFGNINRVRALLDEHELVLSAVNVNTKTARLFQYGALSARRPEARRVAGQRLREGMDVAADFGAEIVTTCPLAEGYDYPFQVNYAEAWDHFVETLRGVVSHRSDVSVVLEYQPHEPYAKILLTNVGKMLHVCAEVDAPNFGANLDVGHSFAAGESPAESAALLQRKGWLRYIHTNDNTGEGGDWDMISGSVHFWDWLELLYTLERLGYDGWFSADIQPKDFGPVRAYRANVLMIQRMTSFLHRIGSDKIAALVAEERRTPELYEYMSQFLLG